MSRLRVASFVIRLLTLVAFPLFACGTLRAVQSPPAEFRLDPPLGFSTLPPVPENNRLSAAKVELGRRLFNDKSLSRDHSIACVTCHEVDRNYSKPDSTSLGIDGRRSTRNAPTLMNRAYGEFQFWDGRAQSLEDQALQPLENPDEMGNNLEGLLAQLQQDLEYPSLFAAAFADSSTKAPEQLVTRENLAKALASFQRTLLLGGSQVDRFRNSEFNALSADARQGMWLFESKANCWKCHSGENFSDERFHNTGVEFGATQRDQGRFLATRLDEDLFRYKTPTLRGVALTAPYMHNGSLMTLADVIEFYSRGGSPDDPRLDSQLVPLNLTDVEKKQLEAFLRALSE